MAKSVGTGWLIGDHLRLFLKNNTFLGSLSDAALDTVLHRGHIKKYSAGDIICRRQERGDTLMLIIVGLIKITNSNVDRRLCLSFLERAIRSGRWRIVQVLCEKLRAASAAIEDHSLDVRRRVARGLLRLALQHGQTSKNGIRVNLTISQSEIA